MSSLRDHYNLITRGLLNNRYTIYNRPGNIRWLLRGLMFNASSITPQTVWPLGGSYTYLDSETTLYLSSTSSNDVGKDVKVSGLDGNLDPIQTIVTLNGNDQVSCGDFYRVFETQGVNGTLEGEVYCAELDTLTGGVPDTTSKIKSIIPTQSTANESGEFFSDHSSHNGFYTVPNGYELHLLFVLGSSTGSEGSLTYRLKLPDQPWLNRNPLPITANRIEENFDPAIILPSGTEIQARCLGGNNQFVTTRSEGWLLPVDN